MIWCISEFDAKSKTCPLSIPIQPVYHPTDGQGIRDGGPWPCAGSECMAWRFVETHIKDAEGNLTVLSGDTHGYCGLAGKPWSGPR